jgi:hypothetical protein
MQKTDARVRLCPTPAVTAPAAVPLASMYSQLGLAKQPAETWPGQKMPAGSDATVDGSVEAGVRSTEKPGSVLPAGSQS